MLKEPVELLIDFVIFLGRFLRILFEAITTPEFRNGVEWRHTQLNKAWMERN